ncbi:FAD/NAD(P)-binding protein [Candidatus Margulisiibacteriota bacterium]
MVNPYRPIETIVEDVITESSTIKTVVLKPKEQIEFKAGQFIELTVPGLGEAPFTPSSSPYVKDRMEVTIMKAGAVTSATHDLKKGDTVGLRGPFGKEYPIDQFKGKDILIVGGGVGLAPLRSLLLALFHNISDVNKINLRYGARTQKDIIYKEQVDKWAKHEKTEVHLTVDNGDKEWKGHVGLITTILNNKMGIDMNNNVAVVCGPPIMMKFSTLKLVDLGYAPENIYLSMERNMSCGIGKCNRCKVGKMYVCTDGPVLTWEQVKDIPDPF